LRRSRFKFWLLVPVLLSLPVLTAPLWLSRLLIHDDAPAKADIAVVLAGDQWGQRILKAAELVRDHHVLAVLVSGPPYYGGHESDAAIDFAVSRGFPRNYFVAAPNDALSTREEARAILNDLRIRNASSFLLVTSDYHTARARRLYRIEEQRMGFTPEFRTIAAPDRYFDRYHWWRSRQGLKIAFLEFTKTIATAAGM
jgi:uncharacterized SAM-binding protein YcdF (DUF218 family)